MREILFRGKRIRTGEWVYGNLIPGTDFQDGLAWIWQKREEKWLGHSGNEVIPESVGQFTGLTDANGTKIFEGDIVKESDTIHNGELQIRGKKYAVEMKNGCWMMVRSDGWDFLYTNADSATVIGNIIDDTNLMKEVDERWYQSLCRFTRIGAISYSEARKLLK